MEDTQKISAPSLLCTGAGSYSIQTPYGYQLDLGFLKYVEEIESGCKAWASCRPQNGPSQRGPRRGSVRSWMPKKISLLPQGRVEQTQVGGFSLEQAVVGGHQVEQTLTEVSQRLQQVEHSRSNSLAELGGHNSPHIYPDNSSDLGFYQSHPSSLLSPAYSPASSDDRSSSQDSGVGPDLAEPSKGVGRGEAGSFARTWWSVVAGDDGPPEEGRDVRDAAVATVLVETCEMGVGTGEAWLLPKDEMERELDTLRHTVEVQGRRIQDLEAQLSNAWQVQKVLTAWQEQAGAEKVCAGGLMLKTRVETGLSPASAWAGGLLGSPGNSGSGEVPGFLGQGAGSIQSAMHQKNEQSTQTDFMGSLRETASPAVTSRGTQWESPEEGEDKATMALVKNGEAIPSRPATATLKSIMKRPGVGRSSGLSAGQRKRLQFVGILEAGHESTSSEEEEEEEEEDEGSCSGASDSSREGEESLVKRNNESETESEEEIEKYELSAKMHKACLILKSHLDDDISTVYGDDVLSSSHTVEQEWFKVSSSKTAQPGHVTGFLTAFSQLFPGLVECVVNMADLNGNTALHYSLCYSNFAVVRVLLDTGVCHADQRNKAGYTPVMLAALGPLRTAEDMQAVRRLFSRGDINAKATQTGQTALMLAVKHRRMEMAWVLLDCGADVNAQDEEGCTALMSACKQGHAHMVSLLLQHPGCDITQRNNDGDTALSIALGGSRSDIAVLLYTHMNRSIPPSPTALSPITSTTESGTSKAIPGRPPLPKNVGIQRRKEGKLKGC